MAKKSRKKATLNLATAAKRYEVVRAMQRVHSNVPDDGGVSDRFVTCTAEDIRETGAVVPHYAEVLNYAIEHGTQETIRCSLLGREGGALILRLIRSNEGNRHRIP